MNQPDKRNYLKFFPLVIVALALAIFTNGSISPERKVYFSVGLFLLAIIIFVIAAIKQQVKITKGKIILLSVVLLGTLLIFLIQLNQ